MAFDSALEERQKVYDETPKEFTEEAAKVIRRKRKPAIEGLWLPNYKTPPFKCLEDFEKCKKHSSSKMSITCRVVFAICIGQQLMPFAKIH
jgi:hypothetical protein